MLRRFMQHDDRQRDADDDARGRPAVSLPSAAAAAFARCHTCYSERDSRPDIAHGCPGWA